MLLFGGCGGGDGMIWSTLRRFHFLLDLDTLAYGSANERRERNEDETHEPAAHAQLDAEEEASQLALQTQLLIVDVLTSRMHQVDGVIGRTRLDFHDEYNGQVDEKRHDDNTSEQNARAQATQLQ